MAIEITGKFKPKSGNTFSIIDAEDVEMPDGTRLSEFKGNNGKDGLTPYIGSNGNWWIGENDTGMPSRGQKGDKGDKGDTGATGATGAAGKDGTNGKDGEDGTDGVSPTVTITTITGGHRVTITDATGTKTFDVMDGEDGSGSSIVLDTTLSKAGQAADAGAVGDAMEEAIQMLDQIVASIPTDDHINGLIDDYLSEALGGDY